MSATSEPRGLSDTGYAQFRELVCRTSGIEVPDSRRSDLERVVLQTLAELGLPDSDQLYQRLAGDAYDRAPLESLIAKLTVGETYFFRNRPQFDALERTILPALIARRRASRMLRLWSAGCASGEEPYSLAILLQRLIPDLADWNILILATDINRAALDRGSRGVYGSWSFREGAASLQPLYFTRRDNQFQIAAPLRRLVQFEYLNLVDDVYPSLITNTHQMDLILCRNVLIYFSAEATRKLAGRMYQALADEGWLLVGHAEPSQMVFHQFVTHNFPGAVIYQKAAPEIKPLSGLVFDLSNALAVVPLPVRPPVQEITFDGASSSFVPPAAQPVATAPQAAALPAADTQTAESLWAAGKAGQAITLLQQVAASLPGEAQAPYLLAKICANRLQLNEAEEWIEIALQRAPLMAPAHYLRGLILEEGGRHWEALEALRGCIYADPQFVLAHFALAGQFAKLGQPQRAQKSLENVLQLLVGRAREELIAEGDGLTVGRLLELVATGKQLTNE